MDSVVRIDLPPVQGRSDVDDVSRVGLLIEDVVPLELPAVRPSSNATFARLELRQVLLQTELRAIRLVLRLQNEDERLQ